MQEIKNPIEAGVRKGEHIISKPQFSLVDLTEAGPCTGCPRNPCVPTPLVGGWDTIYQFAGAHYSFSNPSTICFHNYWGKAHDPCKNSLGHRLDGCLSVFILGLSIGALLKGSKSIDQFNYANQIQLLWNTYKIGKAKPGWLA